MKLLVVENDASLAKKVNNSLREAGFVVDHVSTGAAAVEMLRMNGYDAMSTELALPDMSGLALLSVRESTPNGHIPCIVLTGQGLESRVAALNAGADDCLQKPVSMEELEARFHALLRRPRSYRETMLEAGGLKINLRRPAVWVDNARLTVTKSEFLLLVELAHAYPGAASKEHLENRLYSYEQSVSRNAIEAVVSRLRRKLLRVASSVAVETQRGVGYRLVASKPV